MIKEGKIIFINELVTNVKNSILEKIDSIPEEWDGIELRQLIADNFQEVVIKGILSGSRRRSYNKEIITRNLI